MNLATIYEQFTIDNIAFRVIVLEKNALMKITAYMSLLINTSYGIIKNCIASAGNKMGKMILKCTT